MSSAPCLACALAAGTAPLPGGTLLRTAHWTVEHCVGPLGVGTLLVKPLPHVTGLHELTVEEAAETGRTPGHLHFVVQPARTSDIDRHGGAYGPALQAAMFRAGEQPGPEAVEEFCRRARKALASQAPAEG
ncbi:hypothetical protein [Streptomyces huasconensis]|uniref:hypothetical protein n=1 Tax=Streptomyces huasconensis TaxID=1854574 RepID=UPI0036FC7567